MRDTHGKHSFIVYPKRVSISTKGIVRLYSIFFSYVYVNFQKSCPGGKFLYLSKWYLKLYLSLVINCGNENFQFIYIYIFVK